MSIFFLEGLPRSGKSYESVLRHLLPALKAGRPVITNVHGIDLQKIKQHLGLSTLNVTYIDIDTPVKAATEQFIRRCENTDRPVIPAQLSSVAARAAQKIIDGTLVKNALYLLDEMQNYFAATSSPLPPDSSKFFAEHGHDGIDIVIMGQKYKDVHSFVIERIEVLTRLKKLVAIGQPKRYTWVNYDMGGMKPVKIASGVEKYDPRIFPLYKSHTEGTTNTGSYEDTRNSVFNTPFFKFLVPITVLAFLVAFYGLYQFFFGQDNIGELAKRNTRFPTAASGIHPVSSIPPSPTLTAQQNQFLAANHYPASGVRPASAAPIAPASAVPVAVATLSEHDMNFDKTFVVKPKSKNPSADYYDALITTFHARLSAVLSNSDGRVVAGYLDIVKENMIIERIRLLSLLQVGYKLHYDAVGLRITSPNEKVYVVTSFPIDQLTSGDNGNRLKGESTYSDKK
jgi:zona occludens toxin (predicted ATPase)